MVLLTLRAFWRGIIVQGPGRGSKALVRQRQAPIIDIAEYRSSLDSLDSLDCGHRP